MKLYLEDIQNEKTYNKNEKLSCKENQDRCIVCNKPMDITDNTSFVELHIDGYLIPSNESGCSDSQGGFPVGNECKKKIDKKYL